MKTRCVVCGNKLEVPKTTDGSEYICSRGCLRVYLDNNPEYNVEAMTSVKGKILEEGGDESTEG